MYSRRVVIFVVVVTLCAATAADVDCTKRPQRVDPKSCCPIPDLITAEIREKCKEFDMAPPMPMSGETSVEVDSQQTRPRPPHHHHHHHHHHHSPCFMTCVLNETGIFIDDKLDEAKLTEHLNLQLKDVKDMIPIVKESFKTCVAKGEEFKSRMQNNSRPFPDGCRPRAGFMMGCVFMDSFKNCAGSVWNDNEQCNAMRDHIKSCKPQRGPGGPGGSQNSMENDM